MIVTRQWAGFCLMILSIHIFSACKERDKQPPLFEVLDDASTGLHFSNTLTPTDSFNIFHYMYFYNGAGVGAADFNNDGLVDLFFASNQAQNKLYLNSGELQFKDVTAAAGIPDDHGWSTGVSIADINNDGLKDIYVCRVGNYSPLKSHNQFLICTGIDKEGVPHYTDKAKEMGLDFSGFSTQAAFLDYDMDGDLDMYLLNHSVHENGTFHPRSDFVGTYHPLSGDRLYRNEYFSTGGRAGANGSGQVIFTDVTRESGINSSAIGYGLGIAVSDIDLDGYPDIYIGNDFHENDYLYINQRDGSFKEQLNNCMMHTSQYTMGVDIADVNNDGYSEIITMDMLPADPYILKRSLGEDAYDIFNLKIKNGYNYQYTRNNLQLNERNGTFSEVGLYSGISATDWSWSALWMDFDNNGSKDLFVSNGIPKRMNDIDYINYISNEEIQNKLRTDKIREKDMALIDKFPQIKIPNKFFLNNGNMGFNDIEQRVSGSKSTFSNGAAYADLDNDGDLDVVVNNINEAALVYENKINDHREYDRPYVDVRLKGPAGNINGIGTKLVLFAGGKICLYEKQGVHGFLSGMEIPMHVGLFRLKVDSAFVVWPDNTAQSFKIPEKTTQLTLTWQNGLPPFDYRKITAYKQNKTFPLSNITDSVRLGFLHKENHFPEFDREPLMPHMLSTEGPALAVGDLNNDGLEDLFVGSAKWQKSAVYLQKAGGTFYRTSQPAFENDSTFEDVDACIVDVNKDGFADLVIASGGNEFYGHDEHLLPRVYLNDGKGQFARLPGAIAGVYETISCIVPADFNKDGYVDLFVGGRAMPWAYGQIPKSYLLQNDGTGKFKDVTAQHAKDLSSAGFVTRALWFDLDKDGDKDLLCSFEWGGIEAWINTNGQFTRKALTDKKGWWNFVLPYDVDNDGDIDLVAGNLGANSRLKASDKEPVRLYYNDFDENGKKEQVLTYYVQGREIPFANKSELEKQMPVLKKSFLYAEDFAKAKLNDLFASTKLNSAEVLTANYFDNAIMINDGHMQFSTQPLPWEAQLTSYRDAAVIDANGDSLPDLLMGGNYYENNVEMGRYDADWGTLLINKGQGRFDVEKPNGLIIKGQVRRIQKIAIAKKEAFILARNNDSLMVVRFSK